MATSLNKRPSPNTGREFDLTRFHPIYSLVVECPERFLRRTYRDHTLRISLQPVTGPAVRLIDTGDRPVAHTFRLTLARGFQWAFLERALNPWPDLSVRKMSVYSSRSTRLVIFQWAE